MAGAGGRLRRDPHRDRRAGAGARARDDGDGGAGPADRRRRRGGGATAPTAAGGALRRGLPVAIVVVGGALDPVRGERAVGAARRGLQQRPRAAPGLGGVAAQRLRAGSGRRLPARPARPRGRRRRGARDRSRPGLHRRDLRDRRADRADRARRPGRPADGAAHARRDPGRPPLPRRLLLRPGRLQGDGRGALRAGLRGRPPRPRPPTRRRPPICVGFRPVGGMVARRSPAARARRRDLLLLQLRRARLAGGDRRRCGA